MDESLLFNLLVAKSGFKARIEKLVDPFKEPSTIKLSKYDELAACSLSGTVVDETGDPVCGAIVSVTGAQVGDRIWGGLVKDVDRVSITGQDGVFRITGTKPHDKLQLKVAARRLCEHHSGMLETEKHHTIKMQSGSTVTGYVMFRGKPVANHVIGIYPDQMQQFDGRLHTSDRKIATDENGRFEFVAVRPGIVWNIYSMLSNGDQPGLIETEQFESVSNGKTKNLGDFEVKKTHTLKGKVKMSGEARLPAKTRIFLSRNYARDYVSDLLTEDGQFNFQVPINEVVTVRIHSEGYELSRVVNQFQIKDETTFEACLDRSVKNYEVWIEKK